MIRKLTHVTVLVKDQDEALKWYTEVLDFEKRDDSKIGEMRWLTVAPKKSEVEIVLQKPVAAVHGGEKGVNTLLGRVGQGTWWALEVDDCYETFDELKAKDVKFMEDEPQQMPWGISATFFDLYGNPFNIIELTQFQSVNKEEFQVKTLPEKHVASIRLKTAPDKLSLTFAEIFPEVLSHLQAEGVKPSGPPFGRYHSYGEEVDLEAGMPVHKPIEPKGRVKASTLPESQVATAWHIGDFDKLEQSYHTLEKWIKSEGYSPSKGPWEVYWTDPRQEPDQSNWRTEIIWPIADVDASHE